MRQLALLISACAVLSVAVGEQTVSHAAPELQFPWPNGTSHRILGGVDQYGNPYGGNSYNCGDHTGANLYAIDFQFGVDGSPLAVSAVAGGIVLVASVGYNGGAGNHVVIDHGGGFTSRYLHMQDTFGPGITPGATVSQGQIVGNADNSGFSFGTHLHFDMRLNGNAYKPEPMSTLVNGFDLYGYCTGQTSPYWVSVVPWVRNLLANPSFESGNPPTPWSTLELPPITQAQAWADGTAKSGSWFLEFNTSVQNGSVYQDLTQDITNEVPSAGDSYIFSIWARAASSSQCIDVNLVLWALWGTNESGATPFYNICGRTWRLLSTSLDVSFSDHTMLRAQIYSNVRGFDYGKNLDVDAADLIHVKHKNASFERGTPDTPAEWSRINPLNGTLNWHRYMDGTAKSASWFLQANKSNGNTASIYQDILIVSSPGESYTFSVWLRRAGSGPGAAGWSLGR